MGAVWTIGTVQNMLTGIRVRQTVRFLRMCFMHIIVILMFIFAVDDFKGSKYEERTKITGKTTSYVKYLNMLRLPFCCCNMLK